MHQNHHFLLTWLALLPDDPAEIDEDSYIRTIAARTGQDVADTRTNLRIADQLARMPQLCSHALSMRHLSRKWLAAIERACVAVAEQYLPQLDAAVVALVTPTAPNQALPHWRRIADAIKKLILEIDPPAAEHRTPPGEEQLNITHVTGGPSTLNVTYRPDEAYELDAIIKATARTYDCSKAAALLRLARGTADVKVTLNLYAPATGTGPVSLGGALTLDDAAAQAWVERADTCRDITDVATRSTPRYEIPDTYKAYVKGRDGGCRFPGCGAAPECCDVDHVLEYSSGGTTTPENLQCLCRRCHNLKTDGVVSAAIDKDGNVTWTMPDGTHITTSPQGPVPAKPKPIGRRDSRWAMTFTERRARRIQRRRKP